MADLIIADSFGMRCGLTKRVVSPSTKRSSVVRFGGALSGTIADENLLLEQQRLGGNSTGATRAEQFREGDEQVDREEQ